MNPEARNFDQLLDHELDAARRADVDTLMRIQADKRIAVERLRAEKNPDGIVAALQEKAKRNIQLITHLVNCLQSLNDEVSAKNASYTAAGTSMVPAAAGATTTRGWL